MQIAFLRASLVGFASISAACSPPGAVQEPTWADDVYPIVQGQCLHCHGGSAVKDGGSYRLDLPDFETPVCDDLGTGLGNKVKTSMLGVVEEIDEATQRPLMPPAPARPLEDWQIETIRNWVGDPKSKTRWALGKPTNNHSPTLTVETIVSKGTLTLSYVASDSDGDPVLGEIKVGDNLWHRFTSAGSGNVTFDLAGESGELQITARLCDGWKLVSLDDSDGLKTVDAK